MRRSSDYDERSGNGSEIKTQGIYICTGRHFCVPDMYGALGLHWIVFCFGPTAHIASFALALSTLVLKSGVFCDFVSLTCRHQQEPNRG